MFHICPLGADSATSHIKILTKDIKAVFFVKDFMEDSKYDDGKFLPTTSQQPGSTLEVTFNDGEVLLGTALIYDLNRPGFFLFPLDPLSNNLKVFVASAYLRSINKLTSNILAV